MILNREDYERGLARLLKQLEGDRPLADAVAAKAPEWIDGVLDPEREPDEQGIVGTLPLELRFGAMSLSVAGEWRVCTHSGEEWNLAAMASSEPEGSGC